MIKILKRKELVKLFIILIIAIGTNAILSLSWFTAPSPEKFEYGPILSWVDDPKSSITITWQWTDDYDAYLMIWNESWKFIINVTVKGMETISETVTNLSPGCEYNYVLGYYENGKAYNKTKVYHFRTAPRELKSFKVLVISDTQVFFTGMGMTAFRRLIERAKQEDFDFIIHVGDLVEYSKDVRMWALFLTEISKIASEHPFMAVLGNHDYNEYSGDLGKNFFRFLALPNNEIWYYFNYSMATFVALGVYDYTNFTFPAEEKNMLLRALSFEDKWRIVYFHIPTRKVYNGQWNEKIEEELVPIFREKSPELVIMAHQHGYARWEDGSTTYVILSSASWFIPQIIYYSDDLKSYSFEYGYCVLSVSLDALKMQFKNLDGEVLDEFTIQR